MKKIFLLIILSLTLIGCGGSKSNMGYNNLKDKNHVFSNVSYQKIEELFINKDSFYLFLAFPECPWCKEYIYYVNDCAKKNNVNNVYYLNLKNFRNYEIIDYENNIYTLTGDYQNLINFIGKENLEEKKIYNPNNDLEYVLIDAWIYAPMLLKIENGSVSLTFKTVLGHEKEEGILPPLTSEQKAILIEAYNEIFQ